jgi:flagellar protein FliO/FliZ
MLDLDTFLRFVAALAFVLALLAGAAWLARRYLPWGRVAGLVGRQRRLSVVEVLPLDSRSRLLLVRRDATEHLIVLGPAGAALIEPGIRAGGAAEPALAGGTIGR